MANGLAASDELGEKLFDGAKAAINNPVGPLTVDVVDKATGVVSNIITPGAEALSSNITKAAESLIASAPIPEGAKEVVSKVLGDPEGAVSALTDILGDGNIAAGVGGALAGAAASLLGGLAPKVAANPARTGDKGFDDDRAGKGSPIGGQPQKSKVVMNQLFSVTNPASDYWPLQPGEMNTPRLQRGIIDDTISEAHKGARSVAVTEKGVALEPESPYAAQYPFNSVEESESGHFREMDDTPGAERIKESHRTGTFYEIHPDGSKVTKVVKDNFTAVLGDDSLTVTGSCKVQVLGSCSLSTTSDVNVFAATGITLHAATKITSLSQSLELTALTDVKITAVAGMITLMDSTATSASVVALLSS